MATPRFIASGDLVPFEEYATWLVACGYTLGAPTPGVVEIDNGICADGACVNCGREGGMRYAPYTKDHAERIGSRKWTYVAHWVCPDCGYWEEF